MSSSKRPTRAADDFLVFGSPLIGEEEKREVLDCLDSGWIGTGPRVAQFEQQFREYTGAEHAVAVSSCTAALHLSLLAAGIGPGDEVVTTAMTFCSTINAIIHAGARPVLADIDEATFNIDPLRVEGLVTDCTRAIIPVHFGGRPCDMDALCRIAERHGLILVEDCAHAVETRIGQRQAGTVGEFGCFSFYVTKNVITGEGGMVVCRSAEHAHKIQTLALHGLTRDAWKRFSDEGYKHYYVEECGFKNNMTDLQAAIGIHQLRRVEANWKRREQVWSTYRDELHELPIVLPAPRDQGSRHALHLYTVLIDPQQAGITRDEFLLAMTAENIGVGVHYQSIPVHPYYRDRFGWRPEDYPNSLRIGQQTVSLPLSAKLTERDVADVVRAMKRILGVC